MDAYLLDPKPSFNDDSYAPATLSDRHEDPSFRPHGSFKSDMKPAAYDGYDVADVVRKCTHLTSQQQQQLYDVLSQYPTLFNNELGIYPYEKIHLDIDPTVSPHITRAYPVPHSQLDLFRNELQRLVKIGVLAPAGRSEWISGTFCVPQKDNTVRWVSYFRALNKALKCKVYPIPRIQDILAKRAGYEFLSKIDISMQYYTFALDDESHYLTTIATHFGLFKYEAASQKVMVLLNFMAVNTDRPCTIDVSFSFAFFLLDASPRNVELLL